MSPLNTFVASGCLFQTCNNEAVTRNAAKWTVGDTSHLEIIFSGTEGAAVAASTRLPDRLQCLLQYLLGKRFGVV